MKASINTEYRVPYRTGAGGGGGRTDGHSDTSRSNALQRTKSQLCLKGSLGIDTQAELWLSLFPPLSPSRTIRDMGSLMGARFQLASTPTTHSETRLEG